MTKEYTFHITDKPYRIDELLAEATQQGWSVHTLTESKSGWSILFERDTENNSLENKLILDHYKRLIRDRIDKDINRENNDKIPKVLEQQYISQQTKIRTLIPQNRTLKFALDKLVCLCNNFMNLLDEEHQIKFEKQLDHYRKLIREEIEGVIDSPHWYNS
jgi:hypothetical protein